VNHAAWTVTKIANRAVFNINGSNSVEPSQRYTASIQHRLVRNEHQLLGINLAGIMGGRTGGCRRLGGQQGMGCEEGGTPPHWEGVSGGPLPRNKIECVT